MTDYASRDMLKNPKNKPNIAATLLFGIIGIAFVFGFFTILTDSVDKNEIVKCNSLAAQASQFGSFWLTQEEKEMCDHHEIIVNAPVYDPANCVNGVSIDAPRCMYPEEWFNEQ